MENGDIIKEIEFLKGIELDPWILSSVLIENGARKYSYEIACIIVNYCMLLHYVNFSVKDAFIYEIIEKYKKKLEEDLKIDTEKKIEILKKYAEKYKKVKLYK